MAGAAFRYSGLASTLIGFTLFFTGIVVMIYGLKVEENEIAKPDYAQDTRVLDASARLVQGGVAGIFVGALLLIVGPYSALHGRKLADDAFEEEHRIMPDQPDETIIVGPSRTRGSSGHLWIVLGLGGMLFAAGAGTLLFQLDPAGNFAIGQDPAPTNPPVRPPVQDDSDPKTIRGIHQGEDYLGPEARFTHTISTQTMVDRVQLNLTWENVSDAEKASGVDRLRMRVTVTVDGLEREWKVLEGGPGVGFTVTDQSAGFRLGGTTIRVAVEPIDEGPYSQAYTLEYKGWND